MRALEIVQSAQSIGPDLQVRIKTMLPASSPVDHLANIINMITGEAKALKAKEAMIAQERKTLEALVSLAEKSLQDEMNNEGLVELGGSLVKYILKLNPPALLIEDEKLIPAEYKREVVTVEIRKDAIKDELKMGAEIPGCKLTQGQSLQLKTNT